MTDYISTENLIRLYEDRDDFLKRNPINIQSKKEETETYERKLLTLHNKNLAEQCKSNQLVNYLDRSQKNIDYQIFSDILRNQFYNPTIMETASCFIHKQLSNPIDFTDLLENVEIITGSEDKKDLVMLFSNLLYGDKKIIALKYDANETLHEAILGLFCINHLRQIIPTFVWTYGLSQCNLPLIVKDGKWKKIVRPCTNKGNYVGLITEYVEGETLYDYLEKEIDVKQFYSMILTILYSIKYANERFQFVHWDLHYSNVIMRELEYENSYLYLPGENKYLWVGDKLATIMDLGSSSFVYKDQILSNYHRADLGIRPDLTSSPFNDVIKILSSIYSKISENKILLDEFNKIYSFTTGILNKKYVDQFMQVLDKNFDVYPNFSSDEIIDHVIPITLDELIQKVEQLSPDLLKIDIKPEGHILSCMKSSCLDISNIQDKIMTRDTILTISEFVRAVKNKKKDPFIEEFLKRFLKESKEKIKTLDIPNGLSSPKVSAKSVLAFDELYHLKQQIESLSEWMTLDKEYKALVKKIDALLQFYQKQAILFLRKKKSVFPSDQISFFEKDLMSIRK
jgi:hypothetical protein